MIAPNSKVRLDDGRTGLVLRIDNGQAAVRITAHNLWALIWRPLAELAKLK